MTARRRTIRRRSMKTQSVSKKSLRWQGSHIRDFREIATFNCKGIEIFLKADKNGQLCDIQPRFGNIHSTYQGRPIDCINATELGNEIGTIIGSLSKEQLSALIAGNKLRVEQFKIK